MTEYTEERCAACGGFPHKFMRFERAVAATFNATFAAFEWLTRA